ncbi:MAG: hypothetical protein L3J02_06105 [Henriciella sp.]|nr:hypothetical protein [Henriciella sp.]
MQRVILLLGLAGEAACLPRTIRNQAFRILRPAEAMVRRLLVLMAAKLPEQPIFTPKTSPHPELVEGPLERLPAPAKAGVEERGQATCRFPMIDPQPLPRWQDAPPPYARFGPRIWSPGSDWIPLPDDTPAEPPPVSADSILARIEQLETVLGNRAEYAIRMARFIARRRAATRPQRRFPLRTGRAPGHCRTASDQLTMSALRDLSTFAWEALRDPDPP